MLLEQALFHLPEILTGSGYPRQRYEGGIVAAFSLALLQALNGRNVPNPISCLHAERPFRGTKGWNRGDSATKRYLRSDLYLNLERLEVGSERLSAYGWRSYNWIEAKFFRKSTSNRQQNTGALLADLLRLLVLVPNSTVNSGTEKKIITGRYLLHVYEALEPNPYLSISRQTGNGSESRKWLQPLITGGFQRCPRIRLEQYETAGVLREINSNLGDLEIEFDATTWRIGPTFDMGQKIRQYLCLLTRIDSFTICRNNTSLTIKPNRTVVVTPDWSTFRSDIREHVGSWINIKETESEQPDESEVIDETPETDE
jgi:hypothetical protein